MYEKYRTVFAKIPKPFAFVDMDLLDENIEAIASRSHGKKIRIASKSIRSVSMLRYILEKSDCFEGIMCYTAEEAAFLAGKEFNDLLIGYPIWEEAHICTLIPYWQKGRTIVLMVDAPYHVQRLEYLAQKYEVTIPVCLDFDLSDDYPGLRFGVYRSSVHTVDEGIKLADQIGKSDYLKLDGIMGYEAQIAGVGDQYPGQVARNTLIRILKKRSVRTIAKKRETLVKSLEDRGIRLRFVNGGGTGSLHTTGLDPVVTEMTVGSGFYSPGLFDYFRDFRFQPAAGFAIQIVRQPKPDIFTCLGGGYTASGSAGKDKLPVPYLPEGTELIAAEGAGEVQTPVRYMGAVSLNIGDPIFFRHSKAGELFERFTYIYPVSQEKLLEPIFTYRGEGRCFL